MSAVFVCITPQEPSASLVVAVESANSQARPSCCKAGWTFSDRSLVKVYEFFNPAKSKFENINGIFFVLRRESNPQPSHSESEVFLPVNYGPVFILSVNFTLLKFCNSY